MGEMPQVVRGQFRLLHCASEDGEYCRKGLRSRRHPAPAETRKAYLGLLLLSCEWELLGFCRRKIRVEFSIRYDQIPEYPAGFILVRFLTH